MRKSRIGFELDQLQTKLECFLAWQCSSNKIWRSRTFFSTHLGISALSVNSAYSHRKLNLAMLVLSLKYLCKKLVNQTIPGKNHLTLVIIDQGFLNQQLYNKKLNRKLEILLDNVSINFDNLMF